MRLTAEEHNHFIAEACVSHLLGFGFDSLFPIRKLLDFIPHHSHLVVQVITLAVEYLPALLHLGLARVHQKLIVFKSLHSIRYCLENMESEQGSIFFIVETHASDNIYSSYQLRMEFHKFISQVVYGCTFHRFHLLKRWYRHSFSLVYCSLWLFIKSWFILGPHLRNSLWIWIVAAASWCCSRCHNIIIKVSMETWSLASINSWRRRSVVSSFTYLFHGF